MAAFPVEPALAKILIRSKDYQCTKEVIDILAILSVENVFQSSHETRDVAAEAWSKFKSYDGDLITALNSFKAYTGASKHKHWCRDHFLNHRALKNATVSSYKMV
jgi:HrpA-like RNA helicase